MPKLLYADEISGGSPKSLKVYHGSKRTKVGLCMTIYITSDSYANIICNLPFVKYHPIITKEYSTKLSALLFDYIFFLLHF